MELFNKEKVIKMYSIYGLIGYVIIPIIMIVIVPLLFIVDDFMIKDIGHVDNENIIGSAIIIFTIILYCFFCFQNLKRFNVNVKSIFDFAAFMIELKILLNRQLTLNFISITLVMVGVLVLKSDNISSSTRNIEKIVSLFFCYYFILFSFMGALKKQIIYSSKKLLK